MEKVLYSKFSDDRKKKYCIRTDIVENNGVRSVKKLPLYEEGMAHIVFIHQIYELLCQQYKENFICFNKCKLENDGIRLEYIPCKTLQTVMEEYIERNDETAIEQLLYQYIDRIQETCEKQKFEKTKEFIEVFGDVELEDTYVSLKVTDIDLIFSNIMVDKNWEVIDYEWSFTFPIPIKYVIYRAFYLAHHQMRRCKTLELENMMRIADISEKELEIFQKMEENFQRYIVGNVVPFRNLISLTNTNRTTLGEEFSRRDQEIVKRDQEIVKRDQEIVKRDQEIIKRDQEIVKRNQEIIKRDQEIVKRDQEIIKRDQKITELLDLVQQGEQNLLNIKEENAIAIQKKNEETLQLIAQIEAMKETKWWKARIAILRMLGK